MTPKSVGSQAVVLAVGSGVAQVATALMYLVAARSSAPEELGRAVMAVSLATATFGLVDFGTTPFWIREVASGRLSMADIQWRVSTKFVFTCGVGIIALLMGALFQTQLLAMIPLVLVALMMSQASLIGPRANQRTFQVTALIILERSLALGVMVGLLKIRIDTAWALVLAFFVASILAGVVALITTPRGIRLRFAARRGNPWAGAASYGITSTAVSAQSLDVAILGFFGGISSAGTYGAVNRWTQPMGLLVSAFAQALAPAAAAAQSTRAAIARVREGLWLPLVALIVALVVALSADQLVTLLLGSQWKDSGAVLSILALGTMPAILNQPLSVLLQARGQQRAVATWVIASIVLQLGGIAVLGGRLGEMGGAIAFLVAQCVLLCGLGRTFASSWRHDSKVSADG